MQLHAMKAVFITSMVAEKSAHNKALLSDNFSAERGVKAVEKLGRSFKDK